MVLRQRAAGRNSGSHLIDSDSGSARAGLYPLPLPGAARYHALGGDAAGWPAAALLDRIACCLFLRAAAAACRAARNRASPTGSGRAARLQPDDGTAFAALLAAGFSLRHRPASGGRAWSARIAAVPASGHAFAAVPASRSAGHGRKYRLKRYSDHALVAISAAGRPWQYYRHHFRRYTNHALVAAIPAGGTRQQWRAASHAVIFIRLSGGTGHDLSKSNQSIAGSAGSAANRQA